MLRAVAPERNSTSIVALLHGYRKPQTRFAHISILPWLVLHTNQQTLWSRIILVKLIVAQIVVYRTRRIINVL
jgi:hypothetical protein